MTQPVGLLFDEPTTQGRVHACGTPAAIRASSDPVVAQFIHGHATGPMETPGF